MDITSTSIWQKLTLHADTMKSQRIVSLFDRDPGRAEQHFLNAAGLHLDYSRNLIDNTTLNLLEELANTANLEDQIQRMYEGDDVNTTENRAALHTLLRSTPGAAPQALQQKAHTVEKTLERMKTISTEVRSGKWPGSPGRTIRSIVHLGIGGSYLGPRMIAEALTPYQNEDITAHYVANVDAQHIDRVLRQIEPRETLIVIVSKSFTTTETMTNAHTARRWLAEAMPDADPGDHLIAVTSNIEAATTFGVKETNILPMADWVGGRYSLWSAVGITFAITHGFDQFRALLTGAAMMDRHFIETPMRQNIPVLLALIGIWYHNFFGADSHAVIPYDHWLRLLPAHLQQLDMESNGKTTTVDGEPVACTTGPIVWGGEGTNGQHAFHQLLHQGSRFVSIDFILPLVSHHRHPRHHDLLVANCFAQGQALMTGRNMSTIKAELARSGMTAEAAARLAPHKTMAGNRPSNTILMAQLTPESLGALIAMYEHKVFCQARIWQINPFDQWGVELGKTLSETIYEQITDPNDESTQDPSTNQLIELYKRYRNSV